jgi:hypothetical protein
MKGNDTPPRRRFGSLASAMVAAAITAAAFAAFSLAQGDGSGSGGGTSPDSLAPPPAGMAFTIRAKDRAALEAFRKCMSDHGINPPTPSFGDGPPPLPSKEDRAKFADAFNACRDKLPEGAGVMHAAPVGPGGPPCLSRRHERGHSSGSSGDSSSSSSSSTGGQSA